MLNCNDLFLTREQSRQIDERAIAAGIASTTLMETAGQGCFHYLMEQNVRSALILCGLGNNGGDGLVIARHLLKCGIPVQAVLMGPSNRLSSDAMYKYQCAAESNLRIVHVDSETSEQQIVDVMAQVSLKRPDWIIDALLGTGATGNPRKPTDTLIRIVNQMSALKMAIDVPSGLDCDSGKPGDPTFRANVTCTMATRKIGFREKSAADCLGKVVVIEIGIPDTIVEQVIASCRDTAAGGI